MGEWVIGVRFSFPHPSGGSDLMGENTGGDAPHKDHSAGDFATMIAAARAGNLDALEQLLGGCRDYLMLIANERLDNGLQAKLGASDHVQQTLLAAHQHLAQFRGESALEFRGWLRQILVNDMQQARRRFGGSSRNTDRERPIDDPAVQLRPPVDPQLTPRSDALVREEARLLQSAISRLPANYQQVIRLRDWEDQSFGQIGQKMGISEEAARKLWKRAIQKLEAILLPDSGGGSGSAGERDSGGHEREE